MSTPLDPTLRDLDDCGCCTGIGASTPSLVANRPGLSAIAYRSGTWHDFKRSLLAALSASAHPELARLATRSDDDLSIALLDATAVLGDVLTFYQERIVQELFLRTATERRSIRELARLIGYELRPGVAASSLLSFTVEDAPGAPSVATVGVGVKVQSVPGQDEKPQTFETVEAVEARAAWNAMAPRTVERQEFPGATKSTLWLRGVATGLKTGDVLAIIGPGRFSDASAQDFGVVHVKSVRIESDADRTRVDLVAPAGLSLSYATAASAPRVFAFRGRAALFGHNAPDPRVLADATFAKFKNAGSIDASDADAPTWNFPSGATAKARLDAAYPSVVSGSWVVLTGTASPLVLTDGGLAHTLAKALAPSFDLSILATSKLLRVGSVKEVAAQDFALAGKCTEATFDAQIGDDFLGAHLRGTSVLAASEELELAESPVTPALLPAGTKSATLDAEVGDLPPGRRIVVTGVDAATGKPAVEAAAVDHVELVTLEHLDPARTVTRIHLAGGLARAYRLGTVRILGNVARATHGETVTEVLGAGDAGRAFQSFALRQAPVTFVRDDASPSGAASTLELRVDDIRWKETPTFFGRGPSDRVFVSRRDDAGNSVVRFGDGVHGARPATGSENIRAAYRKGLGTAGNVAAGQLTTLLTRPLGLKGATNPLPAVGGDDPEPRDAARENAPLTVRTLDRVVSLRDYEDFARAYSGVAKALATWTWDGERRGVFVTAAGPGGAGVDDSVLQLLLGALRNAGDPFVPLRVASFRKALFTVSFKATIDPDYEKAKVRGALVDALRSRFAFGSRAFGQAVALAEIVATLQGVAGVVAVDVDALDRIDGVGGSGLTTPLPAAVPQATSLAGALAAELLMLAPDAIVPGEMA